MKKANPNPRLHLMAMGLFLAIVGIVPAQAGQLIGQVTSVDALRNTIVIDGRAFTLSPDIVRASSNPAKTLQPGQAVRYETDGKLIKSIEVVVLPLT